MNKINYLFDMDQMVQRPIPEQRAFELEYYDFLTSLPLKINRAFEITCEERKNKVPLSVNRNWFPNTMNGNLLAEVGTAYPEYVKSTGRGSYCLLMNYKYECYLKKLSGKKLFPSYNHSNTSLALCEQKAMPNQDPIPVIYIGYTTNDSNDDLTGYYAVCIKGKERLWYSDLTAIQPPQVKDIETTLPVQPVTPLVRVKIKEEKKAQ